MWRMRVEKVYILVLKYFRFGIYKIFSPLNRLKLKILPLFHFFVQNDESKNILSLFFYDFQKSQEKGNNCNIYVRGVQK